MRASSRLFPVFLMGTLAITYVVLRPFLATRVPHLTIIEFPAGALVVASLLWAALARPRVKRETPVVWRRHRQVVRVLADPTMGRDLAALEHWIASGEGADEVADVLARAATHDDRRHAELRLTLAQRLAGANSRRRREAILKETMDQGV